MTIEICVPEIKTKASIGRWFKRVGSPVTANEPIVEIETDGKTLEVTALVTGVLSDVLVHDGGSVQSGTVIGSIATFVGTPSEPNKQTSPAGKNAGDKHIGMMGDGTEEQNLNQPGTPGARIKKDEVAAAFEEKAGPKS